MKNYTVALRKSKKILCQLDEYSEIIKCLKADLLHKIEEIKIDNTEIIRKRIQHQPQLHYEEFTSREKEIIDLLSHGLSIKEIAADLNISISTIKTHLANAYAKTGIMNADSSPKLIRLVLFYLKEIDVLNYDWHIEC